MDCGVRYRTSRQQGYAVYSLMGVLSPQKLSLTISMAAGSGMTRWIWTGWIPVFLDFSRQRQAMQGKYGVDFFIANWVEAGS